MPAADKKPLVAAVEVTDGENKPEQYLVHGPGFEELRLSVVDQSLSGYPRFGFILGLHEGYDADHIINVFRAAVERLVCKIPWLAAYLKPSPLYPGLLQGLFKAIYRHIFGIKQDFDDLQRSKVQHIPVPAPVIINVRRSNPGLVYKNMTEPDFLMSYFPEYPKTTKAAGHEAPGLVFNLHFTEDGYLFIAVTYHHALMDHASIDMILDILAAECRLVQDGQAEEKPVVLPGIFDRSAMINWTPKTAPERLTHPWMILYTKRTFVRDLLKMIWEAGIKPPVHGTCRIHLPVILDLLKKWASEDPDLPKISNHDVACAILWRCVMAARLKIGMIRKDAVVEFAQPVDIRRHLPASKPGYLGNALTIVRIELPLSVLLGDDGIREAAVLLRRNLLRVGEENIRQQLGLYVASPDYNYVQVTSFANRSARALILTSWHRLNVPRLDWGPMIRKYAGFYTPQGARPGGFFCVMPALPDGSITTCIAIDGKVKAELDVQDDWNKYVECIDMGPKTILPLLDPASKP